MRKVSASAEAFGDASPELGGLALTLRINSDVEGALLVLAPPGRNTVRRTQSMPRPCSAAGYPPGLLSSDLGSVDHTLVAERRRRPDLGRRRHWLKTFRQVVEVSGDVPASQRMDASLPLCDRSTRRPPRRAAGLSLVDVSRLAAMKRIPARVFASDRRERRGVHHSAAW